MQVVISVYFFSVNFSWPHCASMTTIWYRLPVLCFGRKLYISLEKVLDEMDLTVLTVLGAKSRLRYVRMVVIG